MPNFQKTDELPISILLILISGIISGIFYLIFKILKYIYKKIKKLYIKIKTKKNNSG
jgi:hypothetical protein